MNNGWLMSPRPSASGPAGLTFAARVAGATVRPSPRRHAGAPLLRRLPMVLDAGSRFLVDRHDLRRVRHAPDPDAPAARELQPGQARLAVDGFALTANNISYGAFGDAMSYWRFFSGDDAAWGCIPVWGFADVVESRCDGIDVGQRVYGFLPMGSHLVVEPARLSAHGFVDAAAHRRELPAVYNRLVFCAADPAYDAALEAQQALLRPLFTTSFLIDDFLADNGFFGARQVLLSSASSKTAYGTAFCLSRRGGDVAVTGLTSPANLDSTRRLGCYGDVRRYDDLTTLDPALPTVYVDFSGSAAVRSAIHQHFDAALRYSCAVGGTHWQDLGGSGGGALPGPRPTLFFAPARIQQRSAPPPAGWGAEGLQARIDAAWRDFMRPVTDTHAPWLRVRHARGAAAVEAAYGALVDGRSDPAEGWMLAL